MTDRPIPTFAVEDWRDLFVEIFAELGWGFEDGDYNAADALVRKIYSRRLQIVEREPAPLDEASDKDLFSEIEERRKDPEFKARLDRIMTEEKHILDRLAKDD